jgi:predicted O-linked N-acetylglucosamine transferase (SPINDLY family)
MGASFMATLGQPNWVAGEEDAYVAAAARLAQDCAALRGSRARLREQMTASPLCDITGYVAHFEALLRQMWTAHCADEKPTVLTSPKTHHAKH